MFLLGIFFTQILELRRFLVRFRKYKNLEEMGLVNHSLTTVKYTDENLAKYT